MNRTDTHSPLIERLSWGRMTVDGVGSGKDFKLWPGGGRAWDWNETGTRHRPGIQPADVQELLDRSATVIVLSRGMLLQLQTCPETLELLEQQGISIHVQETKKAAVTYNRLAVQGERVGGLFHSTC